MNLRRSHNARRLKDLAGVRIAAVEQAYHRRLLSLARRPALAPQPGLWPDGDPRPREGNRLDVLIDGAQLLPRVADALAGAHSRVFVAGWFFTPEMLLTNGECGVVLRDLLAEVAARVDVRILMWAGAPLPLFRPWRRDVRRVRDILCAQTGIRCALDTRERPMHTHHEKLIVVDDEVAFVGGIDLTDYDGVRLDTNEHPLRPGVGWHDVAVELHGPLVADVADHVAFRWGEVTGDVATRTPRSKPAGSSKAQLIATVPRRMYRSRPDGQLRILDAYLRGLASAEHFVYLENQFLWSPEIVALLRRKLLEPPSESFRLILVLPAHPNTGKTSTLGQLGRLAEADPAGRRFIACGLYSRSAEQSRPVYVHAKVGIIDDRWLTVGSANLNEGSLFHDTEVNVVTDDEQCARDARLRLWAEHLELSRDQVSGDPAKLFDEVWKPIAEEQLSRRTAGLNLTHRVVRLPYVPSGWGLLGPLQSALIDG